MSHKRKNLSEMSFGSEDDSKQVKEPNSQSQGTFRAVEMTATTIGSETEQQLSTNLALFRMNMRVE